MINISKKEGIIDHYNDVYKINKRERGKYLNTWYIKKISPGWSKQNRQYYEYIRYTTLCKLDRITTENMYGVQYNPLCIFIEIVRDEYKKFIKAQIHPQVISFDDNDEYGEFYDVFKESDIDCIVKKVMTFNDTYKAINGKKFLNFLKNEQIFNKQRS